jgi:hypothetical protein
MSNYLNALIVCLQCGNMAREGLRTLVVGKKLLTQEQYDDFEVKILLGKILYHIYHVCTVELLH